MATSDAADAKHEKLVLPELLWVLKPMLMKFIRCVARHDVEKTKQRSIMKTRPNSVTRSDVTTLSSITSVREGQAV